MGAINLRDAFFIRESERPWLPTCHHVQLNSDHLDFKRLKNDFQKAGFTAENSLPAIPFDKASQSMPMRGADPVLTSRKLQCLNPTSLQDCYLVTEDLIFSRVPPDVIKINPFKVQKKPVDWPAQLRFGVSLRKTF